MIQEFPASFPAVTICNLNSFNLKESFDQSFLFNDESLTSKSIDYYFVEAQENLKRYVANMDEAEQQAISFQLNASLISCSFNKQICDSSNFTSFFDYNYGNCYTFNGGENETILSTTQIGKNYGLELEVLTGDPTIQTLPQTSEGLLLVVHNQTRTLVPSIQLINGINIPPGYNTYISVSRDFHSKLSSPYSKCIADLVTSQTFGSILYNYMYASGISTYDQASCIRLCYQKVVQDLCECYDPKYPSLNNMTIKCLNPYQIDCILNITDNIFLKGNDYINICGFDCPIECNTVDYSLLSSSSFYPSENYVKILFQGKNMSNYYLNMSSLDTQSSVRNYLVKVRVNYNRLGYKYIEEQPSMDAFTLVGNAGGQFGLFIGISLLSFIETIELLIDIVIFGRKKYEKFNSLQVALKQSRFKSFNFKIYRRFNNNKTQYKIFIHFNNICSYIICSNYNCASHYSYRRYN